MKDFRRLSVPLLFAGLMIFLALAPHIGLYANYVMLALCFALFACAFNLLMGFGGLLSFGHSMFLGTAGYVCAHASTAWGMSPGTAMLLAVGASGMLALVSGMLAIRRSGIYFAMVTLAVSQVIYFFYLQAPFTHGEDGIQRVPRGLLFGLFDLSNTTTLYYFVLSAFGLGFLAVYRIIHSPFGDVLAAIRDNERRTASLGYATDRFKLMAFVLSGALAGFAGAVKVFIGENASLTDAHWTMSGEVILMTILGGIGTLFGPVMGAFIVIGMQQYLAQFGQWVLVAHGVIFIVCVLAFRRGIVGQIAHLLKLKL